MAAVLQELHLAPPRDSHPAGQKASLRTSSRQKPAGRARLCRPPWCVIRVIMAAAAACTASAQLCRSTDNDRSSTTPLVLEHVAPSLRFCTNLYSRSDGGTCTVLASLSQVARMADDKPDPALGLAWFQGIRGYSGSGAEAAADALRQVGISRPQATEPQQPSDLAQEHSTDTPAAADQVAQPIPTVAAEQAAAAAIADVPQSDASIGSSMASNGSPYQREATESPAVSMPAAGAVSSAPAPAPLGAAAPLPKGHIGAAMPASQAVATVFATPPPPPPLLARPSSSRRSSYSTQSATPPPHGLYPPVLLPLPQQQGLLRPPLPHTPPYPGSHEYQRILALQVSLALSFE